MAWVDNSPVAKRSKERYEKQSPEIKSILDRIKDPDAYQLKVIRRKRPKLSKGDVFVVNPFGQIYFYGVVLNTGIDDCFLGENLSSVCILKRYTAGIDESIYIEEVNVEDILVAPCIIAKSYWTQGLFYNIGVNIEEKLGLNYGFFSSAEDSFVNEYDEILDREPEQLSEFSITTMIGISRKMNYELVIDNSFLDEDSRREFFEHIQQVIDPPKKVRVLSEFDKAIEPFTFEKEHSRRYSVALTDFEKLEAVFCDNAEGNGYDWEALIKQFVKERFPEERRRIRYDPKAGMFYMYCSDEELMKKVITEIVEELKKNEMREYVAKIDFSII